MKVSLLIVSVSGFYIKWMAPECSSAMVVDQDRVRNSLDKGGDAREIVCLNVAAHQFALFSMFPSIILLILPSM